MREDVDEEKQCKLSETMICLYIGIEDMSTVEAAQLPFYDTSSSHLEA
jgi:hypothetical protein